MYVGRGSKRSIVKLLLNEPRYREIIKIEIGLIIQRELRVLSSKKTSSLLRDKSKEGILSFSWDSMWKELAVNTPTLLNILEAVFSSKPIPLAKIQPTICMVAAILSKFMNPTMNLVQSYISILLHAGHCSKQVCLSFTASLGIIGVTASFLIHYFRYFVGYKSP